MPDINDLLRRRAPLAEELGQLQAKAELSGDDEKRFDAIVAQIKNLDTNIKREEEARKLSGAPVDASTQEVRNNTGMPFASLGEQMIAIAKAAGVDGQVDPRLYAVKNAASGLNESVPSDGGFLLQTDFSSVLLQRAYDLAQVYPRGTNIPISSNASSIKIPAIAESSRADGSRWGGIQVYRANEADTVTAKKPQFDQIELTPEKMMGICYATDDLLTDVGATEAYITAGFTDEFSFKLDDEAVNADGVGKCLGMLKSPCLVTVAKEAGQGAKTILFENISNMWARMWARSRANAVWFVNQDIEPELDKLYLAIGTGGVPVYLPANGLSGSGFATLKGRPVIPIEQCQTLGTVGDIILADMSQYLTVTKGRLQSAQSIHVRFLNDETAFRFISRNGGQPWWKKPLTPKNGSNTLAPFVALATRA